MVKVILNHFISFSVILGYFRTLLGCSGSFFGSFCLALGRYGSLWPQGSVLGPILFNVYINYLFLFIKQAKLHNYADDNTLTYFSKSLSNLIGVLEEEAGVALARADTSHDCLGGGGEKPKFSDDKTINNNSNNSSCRNIRLICAFYDRFSSKVTKIWPHFTIQP